MTYHYQAMSGVELDAADSVVCPSCNRQLAFRRSDHPIIDACGFENYCFECQECGTLLAGIIDPADETLLLSEAA
jgi:ribosomal protein L37AE/L43A